MKAEAKRRAARETKALAEAERAKAVMEKVARRAAHGEEAVRAAKDVQAKRIADWKLRTEARTIAAAEKRARHTTGAVEVGLPSNPASSTHQPSSLSSGATLELAEQVAPDVPAYTDS